MHDITFYIIHATFSEIRQPGASVINLMHWNDIRVSDVHSDWIEALLHDTVFHAVKYTYLNRCAKCIDVECKCFLLIASYKYLSNILLDSQLQIRSMSNIIYNRGDEEFLSPTTKFVSVPTPVRMSLRSEVRGRYQLTSNFHGYLLVEYSQIFRFAPMLFVGAGYNWVNYEASMHYLKMFSSNRLQTLHVFFLGESSEIIRFLVLWPNICSLWLPT